MNLDESGIGLARPVLDRRGRGGIGLTWIVLLADLMSIDSASSRATIGPIIAAIWISKIIIKHAPYVPVRHLL